MVVLRLRKKGLAAVRHVVIGVMNHLNKEPLAWHLWIVDERCIRIDQVCQG